MKEIDITGEKFDFVDCSEGNIFFDRFSEGEKFIIKVWGATLMHELGIFEKDVYIAAMSNLVFENVAYIGIDYGIYADEQGTEFINSIDGKNTHMRLELGKRQIHSYHKEYIFGGILGRNIGYGEFRVYCKGAISITVDESKLIDVTDFCLNTGKYRFY